MGLFTYITPLKVSIKSLSRLLPLTMEYRRPMSTSISRSWAETCKMAVPVVMFSNMSTWYNGLENKGLLSFVFWRQKKHGVFISWFISTYLYECFLSFHRKMPILHINVSGEAVASLLVRLSSDRVVWGHCVVFLGKILYPRRAPLHPVYKLGPANFMLGVTLR